MVREVRVDLWVGAGTQIVLVLYNKIDMPGKVFIEAVKLRRHIRRYLQALREQILDLRATIVIHIALVVLAALLVVVIVVDVVLDVFILARIVGAIVQVVSRPHLRVVGVVVVPAQLSAVVEPIVDRNLVAARGLEAVTLPVLGSAVLALSMLLCVVRRLPLVLLEAFELLVDGLFLGAALVALVPRCLLLRMRLMLLIFSVLLLRAADALFQLLIWLRLWNILALLNFLLVLILPAFLCMRFGILL